MDTSFLLALDRPVDAGLRDRLIAAGAEPRQPEPNWIVSDAETSEVVTTLLTRLDVPFQLFLTQTPSTSDRAHDMSCYLTTTAWDGDQPNADEPAMFRDIESNALLATRAAVKLLTPVTLGLLFVAATRRPGLDRVNGARELPDPVVIPNALFVSQAEDGTWAVQSDGRELLTPSNRAVVREAGLVEAPRALVAGEILPWRRPPIVSGTVWELLLEHEVLGLLDPPPYLGWD